MALKVELMASGMPAGQANMVGMDAVGTIAGAGTNQATATAVTSSFTIISTAAASTGVVLGSSAGSEDQLIYNGGANTLKIYGNGSQTINGIAGATGISLPTLKAARLTAAGTGWIAVVSA